MISKSTVKKFLDCKINVIGVDENKQPTEGRWGRFQTEFREVQNINADGLALICGKISDNLEVVDIDTKYDLTSSLYDDYCALIRDNSDGLLDKLMIIQTPSGGYHFLYRCELIQGNQKLSRRLLTEDEAKKSREKWRVLIETRGEGGYIASLPTRGYKAIQGRFSNIPVITKEERDILHSCARTFDEEINEIKVPKSTMNISGLTPWDDYDQKHTCLELIQAIGWSVVKEDNRRIFVKRSGDTNAMHSGNILKSENLFKCFSSSTEFEPEKAYTPFAMYAVIYHGGNFSVAAKQLYRDGYGEQKQTLTPEQQYEKSYSSPKPEDDIDVSMYLSDSEEDDKYADDVRNGNIKMGLTTGSTQLDEHFRFKEASLIMAAGHTNVGKTLTGLFLVSIAAVLHNWKCVLISMENKSGFVKRKLREIYACCPIEKMSPEMYEQSLNFVDEHFYILKGRGGLIKDAPTLLRVLYKMCEDSKYNIVMADPYSAFEKDLRGVNTHEYDYRVIGDFLDFTERTGASMLLTAHTATHARRTREEDGTLKAPFMDDVEGGGKFPNRVDTSLIWHRKTNAEVPIRYITEWYTDKERETETGGSPTQRDNPVNFMATNGLTEFEINGINPIRKWHEENGTIGFKKPETYSEAMERVKEYNTSFDNETNINMDEVGETPPF